MALVIGIIGLVILNYWFLVARFPQGGGDAAAAGGRLTRAHPRRGGSDMRRWRLTLGLARRTVATGAGAAPSTAATLAAGSVGATMPWTSCV
jgi:hypothetical protein